MAERPAYCFDLALTVPRARWEAWEMLCLAYGSDPEDAFCTMLAGACDRIIAEMVGVPPEETEDEEATDAD